MVEFGCSEWRLDEVTHDSRADRVDKMVVARVGLDHIVSVRVDRLLGKKTLQHIAQALTVTN